MKTQVTRWFGFLLASLVLAGGLSACKSEPSLSQDSEPAPSVTLGTASTSTPSSAHGSPTNSNVAAIQHAVAAYRGMWQAYDEALRIPDPSSPSLSRYATGEALQVLVSGLTSVKDKGLRGTGCSPPSSVTR
jgi:hypothetical protein